MAIENMNMNPNHWDYFITRWKACPESSRLFPTIGIILFCCFTGVFNIAPMVLIYLFNAL